MPGGADSAPGSARGSKSRSRGGRGAIAVASGILVSRITGLLRERAFSFAFGLFPHADVISSAFRIPNLLQNMLGEQTLSASFIPIYARMESEGRKADARRFAGAILGLLAIAAAATAAIGVLAARPIVALLAPGFLRDASAVAQGAATVDRFELAAGALHWMFPMTAVLVLSAWSLGVLNSHGRFFLSYVAPAAWNAVIIGAIAWVAWRGHDGAPRGAATSPDRLLLAVCIGAFFGAIVQLAVQLPSALRLIGGLRLSFSLAIEGVRPALRAFLPALAGRGVVQFSAFLDQMLASLLAVGAQAALRSATTLYLLPISLFGMSIAAAALPDLARASGTTNGADIGKRIRAGVCQNAVLNLPASIAFVFLGVPIVAALFRTGRFGSAEVVLVAAALGAYALGLPASTASRLLQSGFFALGDTRTPARVAAERVTVSVALGVPLMLLFDRIPVAAVAPEAAAGSDLRLGAAGLAIAASVSAWYEWARLERALRNRLHGLDWPWKELLRTALAALLAVVPAFGASLLAAPLAPVLRALVVLPVFGGAYIASCMWLGVTEISRWAAAIGEWRQRRR